ncbi:hypothetical protein [Alkalibacillus haloalkaliphilus]|uniref:hypothetical protein n=1 Tax=Alkalibacillus haloalkaliphilus TaxID=94136 RepID=UPI0029363207|nr:hypothetical protein [Alkalibacillus haloalkaliphilus]MDV2581551.1 hypothetical protein [Alkalibacillus haloalkaliphilus]
MHLQDVLPLMSKMYLSRTVDSFLKDVKLNNEEEMRDIIIKNIDEFKNAERVKLNLDFREANRDITLMNRFILKCLLGSEGYILSEKEMHENVLELERQILEDSRDDYFVENKIDETSFRVYSAVLNTAWSKGEALTSDEINILYTLREVLGLTTREHYIMESRIGRFPQKGNKLHNSKHVDQSLKDLQLRGILLRFKTDDVYYVIPHDIVREVRYEMGEELRTATYIELLNSLNIKQIKTILSTININMSGNKDQLVDKIVKYNILPSKALSLLNTSDLTQLLRSLDGSNVSGTKETKIQNIIDYYENVTTTVDSDPTDERSIYYDYFDDLASRNYKALRANKVIEKDNQVEKYFEEATRYLFEKKLKLQLENMKGSKHADGKIKISSKDSLLWDNKSVEKPYTFPEEHLEQFLGYIRSEPTRVSIFLIVTSDFTQEAVYQAQKLKAFSEDDTDVAIITAENLKYVSEVWEEYSGKKEPEFSHQVLNLTGGLNRSSLTSRMEWALK